MLVSLHIENIAVIEKADIDFHRGLNVLTGETGAGKSIVIDSINAVLGERVSRDLVRTGSEQANVTAVFAELSEEMTAAIEELGYALEEDGTLLIQRSISAEGKGGCRINGRPATVTILRTIGRMLVNIHGQHENQNLLQPERHVEYLDRIGGLLPLREQYAAAYHTYCDIHRRLKKADMDETLKARRLDLLRYQIEEIEAAAPKMGEEEALTAQRRVYRNAEKIAGALQTAKAALSGEEDTIGALAALSAAADALTDAGRYMDEVAQLARRVESLLYELEECAGDVREYASQMDFDEGELEAVENRLDVLRRLTAKYGGSEETVLQQLEEARQELDEIEMSDALVAKLTQELEQAETETVTAAQALTAARQKAAGAFAQDVMEQLAFLDMPGVKLEVSLQPVSLTAIGGDKVEFLIAANPGEPPKPIAKIASGGELSRIMLAIQSVLADIDDTDTLVFDEIDTGISGRAAQKVGIKLRETATGCSRSRSRQVLCVTHLAQIAAQAHHHLLIAKTVRDGRTYTQVTGLDADGREQELARIIGGEVTEASRHAACEMLERAAQTGAAGAG